MADEVPPRVLAAERRRDFRNLLARGSLGCPSHDGCGHLLSEHAVTGWDDRAEADTWSCRHCDCAGEAGRA